MKLLADAVALLHGVFALYIAAGCVFIPVGLWRHWSIVRNFAFRFTHLAALFLVTLLELAGQPCPLTLLENRIRAHGAYTGGFIQEYVGKPFHLPVTPSKMAWLTLPALIATGIVYIHSGPVRDSNTSVSRTRLMTEMAILIVLMGVAFELSVYANGALAN